jgi:hypothetical protein
MSHSTSQRKAHNKKPSGRTGRPPFQKFLTAPRTIATTILDLIFFAI